jgi:hypothetical protein
MNYPDNNLRMMQIIKYILLNQVDSTSKIINNVSTKKTKEDIFKTLLKSKEMLPFLSKKSNLKLLKNTLSSSVFLNPVFLANYLPGHYSTRSLNIFIKTLFENQALKEFKEKRMPQQKPLTVFLE